MAALLLSLFMTLFVWSSEASFARPTTSSRPPTRPIPVPCRRVPCLANPCEVETCPRFPNARCKVNFCGACNAVFFDKKYQVIPKFACPADNKWPECLASAGCPALGDRCRTGCPGVRDAVCSQNCDCSTVFTDKRTGRVLGSSDCFPQTRQCPKLVLPKNIQVRCSRENYVGSYCRLTCPRGQSVKGGPSMIVCFRSGRWSRSVAKVTCGFDNRCPPLRRPGVLDPASVCPACPAKGCSRGQICCQAGCGSTCLAIPRTCPGKQPPRHCPYAPCDYRKCYGHPEATCTNNYCGGCNAIFTDPKTNHAIPQFACQKNMDWPACLRTIKCASNIKQCKTGCPGVPDARCLRDCNCKTIFVDKSTGKTLTSQQCRPSKPKICPPLVLLKIKHLFTYQCTRSRYVGSVCKISCPGGYILHGVSTVTCTSSGKWSRSLGRTKCVLNPQCPLVKRSPTYRSPYCQKCPRTCPKGTICCLAPRCGSSCVAVGNPNVCPSLPAAGANYNVRCTKKNYEGSVCWLSCPKRQRIHGDEKVSCKNSSWSADVSKIRCVDVRCPIVKPVLGEIPLCSRCPKTCLFGEVCCPTVCGSRCTPVGDPVKQDCPPPFHPKARVSFRLSCTNGYQVGSRCNVQCPKDRVLIGTTQIQCLLTKRWNQRLGTTQCVPKNICPPGTPIALCTESPCKRARCPGVPEAACVDNFCGGCNFDFFVNGRKLSKKECIPRKPCVLRRSRSYQSCRNPCVRARCPANPAAICKPDCFCVARFYNPITFEKVDCKKSYKPVERVEEDDEEEEEDDDETVTNDGNDDNGENDPDDEDDRDVKDNENEEDRNDGDDANGSDDEDGGTDDDDENDKDDEDDRDVKDNENEEEDQNDGDDANGEDDEDEQNDEGEQNDEDEQNGENDEDDEDEKNGEDDEHDHDDGSNKSDENDEKNDENDEEDDENERKEYNETKY